MKHKSLHDSTAAYVYHSLKHAWMTCMLFHQIYDWIVQKIQNDYSKILCQTILAYF
jgi:hypothetical protein